MAWRCWCLTALRFCKMPHTVVRKHLNVSCGIVYLTNACDVCMLAEKWILFAEGSTRHSSASLIYSWDLILSLKRKKKNLWWIRRVNCLNSFCCLCLTFVWGMGMDCSVKLSKTGVFQHDNKLLGSNTLFCLLILVISIRKQNTRSERLHDT